MVGGGRCDTGCCRCSCVCVCVCVLFIMAACWCAGIYHTAATSKKLGLDKHYLGEKVLPFLIPLSLEPSLNLTQVKRRRRRKSCAHGSLSPQFNQFMAVIREMLKQLETEQQAHLKQLSKMEEQTQ